MITRTCAKYFEKDGIYIIKGKLIDGNLDNYINVEIPFGSPDSTGLCDIKFKISPNFLPSLAILSNILYPKRYTSLSF